MIAYHLRYAPVSAETVCRLKVPCGAFDQCQRYGAKDLQVGTCLSLKCQETLQCTTTNSGRKKKETMNEKSAPRTKYSTRLLDVNSAHIVLCWEAQNVNTNFVYLQEKSAGHLFFNRQKIISWTKQEVCRWHRLLETFDGGFQTFYRQT